MHIVEKFEVRNFDVYSYYTDEERVSGERKIDNQHFSLQLTYLKSNSVLVLKISLKGYVKFNNLKRSISIVDISKAVNPILENYRAVSYNVEMEDDLTQSDIDLLLAGLDTSDDEFEDDSEGESEESIMTRCEMADLVACDTEQDFVKNESSLHFEITITNFEELDFELTRLDSILLLKLSAGLDEIFTSTSKECY